MESEAKKTANGQSSTENEVELDLSSIPTKYHTEYDYEKALKIIDRMKSRCRGYRFEIGGYCSDDWFRGILDPIEGDEERLDRDHPIVYMTERCLLELNEQISGDRYVDAIADMVATETVVVYWGERTKRTFVLKPEYAQLLSDELDELEERTRENYSALLAEKRAKEAQRELVRKSIASIKTEAESIEDEGGWTKMFLHEITLHDGETLSFTERSVFDFGVVVNPTYCVSPGFKPGGVCFLDETDGVKKWYKLDDDSGFVPVRPLTDNEDTALKYLAEFGGFRPGHIRM